MSKTHRTPSTRLGLHKENAIIDLGYYRGLHFTYFYFLVGCPSIDPAATTGVIYSPNFPWDYGSNTMCTWTITSPSQDKMTHLIFTDFDLTESYNYQYRDCYYDIVYVKALYGSYYATYGYHYNNYFCGTKIPSPISTDSKSITVEFFSRRGSFEKRGFLLFYQKGYKFSSTLSPYVPSASLYGACTPSSNNSKFCVHGLYQNPEKSFTPFKISSLTLPPPTHTIWWIF